MCTLKNLKSLEEKQKQAYADHMEVIRNHYNSDKVPDVKVIPILINFNLESVVNFVHQEKLKRDRIGTVF